jgi:hypothetical protein
MDGGVSVLDLRRLTAEVAARHGLLLREDDPAMALVTMSEIVLGEVLDRAELRWRDLLSQAEAAQEKWQQETVLGVQQEMEHASSFLRLDFQRDRDAARLEGRELAAQVSRVYSRSAARLWIAIGLVSALVFLALGVGLGIALERFWR